MVMGSLFASIVGTAAIVAAWYGHTAMYDVDSHNTYSCHCANDTMSAPRGLMHCALHAPGGCCGGGVGVGGSPGVAVGKSVAVDVAAGGVSSGVPWAVAVCAADV